ncbi:hypothetical protein ACH4NV_04720 [Streptomyces althioticus]|uniref:hypothetical protein n=1 Tax=Streptomyces TaxID=1883 RepID=UPI0035B4C968
MQTEFFEHAPELRGGGAVLDATLGWSEADPIAALVIAAIALMEGRDAWQSKDCCAPSAPLATRPPTPGGAYGCRPGCDCCT